MNLTMVTGPPAEPITLSDAKNFLRVDSTQDDTLIPSIITAARMVCETVCNRTFVQTTWMQSQDRFPYAIPINYFPFYTLERMPNQLWGRITLPQPPIQSVTSIVYIDPNGDQQTLDPSLYQVEVPGNGVGTITPAYGTIFPATRLQLDAVQVTFVSGYDNTGTLTPECAKMAIRMMINHLYNNRTPVRDVAMVEVPWTVRALLAPLQWGCYA